MGGFEPKFQECGLVLSSTPQPALHHHCSTRGKVELILQPRKRPLWTIRPKPEVGPPSPAFPNFSFQPWAQMNSSLISYCFMCLHPTSLGDSSIEVEIMDGLWSQKDKCSNPGSLYAPRQASLWTFLSFSCFICKGRYHHIYLNFFP